MYVTAFITLVIFSIAELVIIQKFIAKKEKTALKSVITSCVLLWLVFIASFVFKFTIPAYAYLFVVISLFTDSFFGYYLGLYYKSKKFDRIQHVLGSFSFAIFSYFLFSNFFVYGGSKVFQAFYILLLGVFYGTLYEIIEFVSDLKNDEKMQRGLRDTNFDMISNVVGSLSASILAFMIFI